MDEAAIREYIERYDIEVPESAVENELQYITLEMKHRMQYSALTGGGPRLGARAELEAQAEELRRAAYYEAKSELVIKDIIAKQGFTVTKAELEAEAEAMAARQGTTVEMIKSFFGEDLAMLERDVKITKAMNWIEEQIKSI